MAGPEKFKIMISFRKQKYSQIAYNELKRRKQNPQGSILRGKINLRDIR